MSSSRTKNDLMIETWEKLDCESVGAREIIAIDNAVRERFGEQAIDSPMVTARLLADEGAYLRHAEIMELYVERNADSPYDAIFRNVLKLSDLRSALSTLRNLEGIRRKFVAGNDKNGLRLLRETVLEGKNSLLDRAADPRVPEIERMQNAEIAEWLTIWLQSPEIFENWVGLRQKSPKFTELFGDRPET